MLHRENGYELHTLKSFGIQEGSYLRTSPKGQEATAVVTNAKVVNPVDVIDVLYGQEAGETFIFEGGRFR